MPFVRVGHPGDCAAVASFDEWRAATPEAIATDAELWMATETTPYNLVDTVSGDFAGPSGNALVAEPLGYTSGRGMFNNGVADWADAKIDEIRISDAKLTPDEFLFSAVPEPQSLCLVAVAALGLRRNMRRRRSR